MSSKWVWKLASLARSVEAMVIGVEGAKSIKRTGKGV